MKTVKQIAEEHGTQKQIIHRIIKRKRIETIQDGNRILIDEAAEQAIIEALRQLPERTENDSKRFNSIQNDSERIETIQNDSTDEGRAVPDPVQLLLSQVEELRTDKERLISQLEDKQRTIDGLLSQLENLTAALRAAQALHGIEKQQKVIEIKEAAAEDPTPARSERRASSERQTERKSKTVRPAPEQGRTGKLTKIIQDIRKRLH